MKTLVVGVVGPCGAGKTTLIRELRALGFPTRHIAQEHSYAPAMWQRLAHPDVLIYLDVSFPLTLQRRKLDWTVAEYSVQIQRLRHAYDHADLYIDTDPLTPTEVLQGVLGFIALNC
jgi:deoxyadenosine/deoxycytidine kinase